jgi:hypothetical protein
MEYADKGTFEQYLKTIINNKKSNDLIYTSLIQIICALSVVENNVGFCHGE